MVHRLLLRQSYYYGLFERCFAVVWMIVGAVGLGLCFVNPSYYGYGSALIGWIVAAALELGNAFLNIAIALMLWWKFDTKVEQKASYDF